MVIMPLQDNVVIKIPKKEKLEKTKSGIYIAKTENERNIPEEGIIVALGEGRILNDGTLVKSELAISDKVIFNKFAGTKISDSEDEFLIVKENDILAIIK